MPEARLSGDDEYLVRLSQADRLRLTARLLKACGRPILAAALAAAAAGGALIPSLWTLAGVPLKALTGYTAAVTELGSVGALAGRLALFAFLASAAGSAVMLSLNALIAQCLEGETPRGPEEALALMLAPWREIKSGWGPLAVWPAAAAAWGATLALASLPPLAGPPLVLAGGLVFALLCNCALCHFVHPERDETGAWASLALPFRLLRHSDILWRKTLTVGLAAALPGLALAGLALSPLVKGPAWSLSLFLPGLACLAAGLAFFSCFFTLTYKQALANYRLRRQPLGQYGI